jgi:carbon storage regulator CsrA
MLVLSRRPGEAIVVPGLNLTIRVLGIKGGTVRLGIDAPYDLKVLREELLAQPDLTAEAAQPGRRLVSV